jgi:hypothetical protein
MNDIIDYIEDATLEKLFISHIYETLVHWLHLYSDPFFFEVFKIQCMINYYFMSFTFMCKFAHLILNYQSIILYN